MENIYLVGMMGSGKSTTASELAKLLGRSVIDVDDLIVEYTGKSINQIFTEDGESAFRDLESKLLHEAARERARVIATGGGVILKSGNVDLMRGSGAVIYLKTSFPVLWERVKHHEDRPLLKGASPETALKQIFAARTPLYEQAAHHTCLTDHKTPKEVAREIFETILPKIK